MKNLLLLILSLSFCFSLSAQAPTSFSYQGVVRDVSDVPIVNRNIKLRVAILRSAVNGQIMYQETHDVTTTAIGLFNIEVGSGDVVSGDLNEINWRTGLYFLKTELDENGGNDFIHIGTSQLLSVPFAMYAERTGTWQNYDVPDLRKGISNTLNSSVFDINTRTSTNLPYPDFPQFQMIQSYTDSLFGPQGFVSFNLIRRDQYNGEPTLEIGYSAGQGLQRNMAFRTAGLARFFFKGNGNLGLGTTEPTAKLHVADGDIFVDGAEEGVIMKSPNGRCWKFTPDNNGNLVGTLLFSCP